MCGYRETGKAVWETRRPFSLRRHYPAGAVSASRAAALLIFSTRRACAGAIFSFIKARISGGAVSGEPALNGGGGVYLSPRWIPSAGLRLGWDETRGRAQSVPAVTSPPPTP